MNQSIAPQHGHLPYVLLVVHLLPAEKNTKTNTNRPFMLAPSILLSNHAINKQTLKKGAVTLSMSLTDDNNAEKTC